jgi:hypothetical protein
VLNYKIDVKSVERLSSALDDLAEAQRKRVTAAVINDIGDYAYPRVVRTLSQETGAQQKRVRGFLVKKRAYPERPTYQILARGEFMSLKDFKPVQRKAGVQAAPWGDKRVFPHTFFGPGGHVYKRTSSSRVPIEKLWGPAIPRQLLRGKTDDVVKVVIEERLPVRLAYQYDREVGRVKKKYRV